MGSNYENRKSFGDSSSSTSVATTTTTATMATKTNEPQRQRQQQQQENKVMNWSGSPDSSSNNQLQPQQQQQHTQQQHTQQQQNQKQQQKSSLELYKEAAELLGLSCTLCDNCRCLDCQSGYFDCDDSDSYSEFSTMDDYDYEYEEQTQRTANELALIMHARSAAAPTTDLSASLFNSQTASNFACCDGAQVDEAHVGEHCGAVGESGVAATYCYCDNVNCGMEPHTNDLDDSVDKSSSNRSTYASKALVAPSTKTTLTLDSITLENTTKNVGAVVDGGGCGGNSDCGALITALNSVSWQESQAQEAQQHQEQHHHQHQHHRQQHRRQHQPPPEPLCNEVENCASFNGLSLLDAKTFEVDSVAAAAASCEQK